MYFYDWEWEVLLQCWMSEGMILDLRRECEMWRGQILQFGCLSTAQVRWSCRIQTWPWDDIKIDQVVSEEWRWPLGILYVSHGQFAWDDSIRKQWGTLHKNEEVTKVLLLLRDLPQGWSSFQIEKKRDVMFLFVCSKPPSLSTKKFREVV